MGVRHVGADFKCERGRLGQRHVNIRTEIVTREMNIGTVIRVGIVIQVAIIAQIACRYIVTCPLATAPHIDRYLRIRTVFREKFVEPVDIGIKIGIGARGGHPDLFRSIELCAIGFVSKPHVVGTIEQFGHIHQIGDTALNFDIDSRLLCNTAAGSYQNDSICGSHSVNGCCGCILQN